MGSGLTRLPSIWAERDAYIAADCRKSARFLGFAVVPNVKISMIESMSFALPATCDSKARFVRQDADWYRKDCDNGAGNLAFFLRAC